MALPEIFDAGVARRAIVEFLADGLESLLAVVENLRPGFDVDGDAAIEGLRHHSGRKMGL